MSVGRPSLVVCLWGWWMGEGLNKEWCNYTEKLCLRRRQGICPLSWRYHAMMDLQPRPETTRYSAMLTDKTRALLDNTKILHQFPKVWKQVDSALKRRYEWISFWKCGLVRDHFGGSGGYRDKQWSELHVIDRSTICLPVWSTKLVLCLPGWAISRCSLTLYGQFFHLLPEWWALDHHQWVGPCLCPQEMAILLLNSSHAPQTNPLFKSL